MPSFTRPHFFFWSLSFDWLHMSCVRVQVDAVENKVEEKYKNIYSNFKGSIKINLFNCNHATKTVKVISHLPIATY